MSIDQALLHIKSSGGEPFNLVFVRGSGKRRGSIKIVRCIYGVKNPRDPGESINQENTKAQARIYMEKKSWKENGQIPVVELETGRMITPLISHIIGFNEYKIKH